MAGCGCMSLGIPHASGQTLDIWPDEAGINVCAKGPAVLRRQGVRNIAEPHEKAQMLLQLMCELSGIQPRIQLFAADFIGDYSRFAAYATIKERKRYIVYDRASFNWKPDQTTWAEIGILGHEIGHHVASHVYADEVSRHAQELEADRFSGFIMSKMGASLSQAQTMDAGNAGATDTHPSSASSRKAIEEGWQKARTALNLNGDKKVCEESWSSSSMLIHGSECRIATTCENDGMQQRLACQDFDGSWRWR